MKVVVKNGGNEKVVKVLNKEGSVFHVSIGDREYKLDIVKVEDGVYSILNEGRSINMEMIETDNPGQYKVNTLHEFFNIEVGPVSSSSGIEKSKKDALQKLTSPMSGKIVKINAKKGDIVAEGASLIILSAMKMENEFNSTVSGTVTRVEVKEGDLVREGQLLLEIKATIN